MLRKIYNKGKVYAGSITIHNVSYDGRPIGFVDWFAANNPPEGWLVCDGSAVSRTEYAELFSVVGTLWGAGDGSTTFNLPPLIGRFAEGGLTAGAVKEAGLPNIQGNIAMNYVSSDGAAALNTQRDGAFSRIETAYGSGGRRWPASTASTGDSRAFPTLRFNAANSNAIYGKSTTVQPAALTLVPCIKAKPMLPPTTGDGDTGGDGSTSGPATIALSNVVRRRAKLDLNNPTIVYAHGGLNFSLKKDKLWAALDLKTGEHILGGDDLENYIELMTDVGLPVQRSPYSTYEDEITVSVLNHTDRNDIAVKSIYFTYFIYKVE